MKSIIETSKVCSVETKVHVLPDINSEFKWPKFPSSLSYRGLLKHTDIVDGWVSFDVVAFDPYEGEKGCVWCGLNVLNPTERSILRKYDLANNSWSSIDLKNCVCEFDLKIHKGINITKDELIFATASFEDPNDQFNAPGGRIIVYNKKTKNVTHNLIPLSQDFGFPISGQYIQSLAYNPRTQKAYGACYPLEVFFEWDRASNKVKFLGHLTGSLGQPHNFAIDDVGHVWGTYGLGNGWSYVGNNHPVRPFRYKPENDQIEWFEEILFKREDDKLHAANDSVVYCNQWVYFGDKGGNLNRVHTKTLQNQFLGRVTNTGRVPAMVVSENHVWGTCGDFGDIYIFRIEDNGSFTFFGPIVSADGVKPERLHELTYVGNNRFFTGENDNHKRSSYMYEVKLS